MQLLNILISRKKTLGCVIPHIGTFHWLAMGPTHGLLSRRSTDRISTSPLANFAQLSMFRFDGLIKNHSCFIVNNNSCINDCIGFIWLFFNVIYF